MMRIQYNSGGSVCWVDCQMRGDIIQGGGRAGEWIGR